MPKTSRESLICRSNCKKLALRWAKDQRKGCDFTRVSSQFLDDLEAKLRLTIQKAVNSHRSVGKTITDLL